MPTALKWTVGLVLALLMALALFLTFSLNALRGAISRAVTEATGRQLIIQGNARTVWTGLHPSFRVEQVTFANPSWAKKNNLFSARAVEAEVRLLPLLRGRVVVPQVRLEGVEVNLEQDKGGRKSWVLDTQKEQSSRVHIERVTLDRGRITYADAARDIDIRADLHADERGLVFAVTGGYRGLHLSGSGHTGPMLSVGDEASPFSFKAQVTIGETQAAAEGTITGLVALKQLDTRVRLSGRSLADLYGLIGVALPHTPSYTTEGRLLWEGTVLRYEKFTGKVGSSDLAGTLGVDIGGKRPFMRGELESKVIDLADLGVVVGAGQPRKDGVLPDSPFDRARWDSVDAEVRIKAGRVRRPRQLPLEHLSARIQMKNRVLTLNPLEFGVAGGTLVGPLTLDGRNDTIRADVKMRVQKLQLAQLFPTLEQNKTSVGEIGGLVELSGSGNSVARMLASANGKIGVFMDGGEISRLMMELVALDLWNAARVELKGDEQIAIHCAIADFAVKEGVANTNALVFDTSVVLVEGAGTINLKTEEMDIKLNPKPKDSSIVSLNSPLYVRGTFSDPKASPDVGKLAVKGVAAVLLGIVNPLLAVLPLFKEGKEHDTACQQLIAEASAAEKPTAPFPGGSAASRAAAKRRPSPRAR